MDLASVLPAGLGVFVALEGLYFLLRRFLPRFRMTVLYHLWALAVATWVSLERLPMLDMDQTTAWKVVVAAVLLLSGLVAFAVVDALVFQRPWRPVAGPLMPKLALDVLRLGLLIGLGLVVATRIYGANFSTVLVSSTVLSAVVGLALQDVLKNVFAGLSIDFERPFARGDWLMMDGVPAQVIDLSWRSTRLRTNEGVEIYEPNATMSSLKVVNLGNGTRPVAFNFFVGLPYETPPARVRRVLLAAAESAPDACTQPAPEAFLKSYGDSAINYQLRVWTRAVARLSRFTDGVYSRIWYELKREGIEVPFPIRTVLLHPASEEAAKRATVELDRAMARLGALDLFDELRPETLRDLAASAHREQFDAGQVLMREGDAGSSLFVVESGHVRVSKGDSAAAGRVELARLGPGDVLGEMSLLTGEPRSATVTADEGAEVLVLSKQAVAPVLAADPTVAEYLSRALAARRAETAATLESHRGQTRRTSDEAATLLGKIREFFRL